MAVEMIGAAGMEHELKQTYDRKLLETAEKDYVFLKYGEKRPIPARGGKSIEFRRFERITITAGSYTLTEGTTPTETQATISHVTCTISQYGQYSKISQLLNKQSFDPVIAEFAKAYGEAMAEGLDVVVRNALSSATTIQYADDSARVGTSGTGATGSGNYCDAAELLEMKRTLRRNGTRAPFTCLIHPDNTKDLMEDPDIRDDFRWTDPGAIKSGNIGQWMGINFVETNNLRVRPSYGMSGADIYEVFMFGRGFYGISELSAMQARMIIHDEKTEGGPLEMYSTVGWKAALAVAILNNDFGAILNCASSRSNAA